MPSHTQNEKAAKTAMFTIPVNIAALLRYPLLPLSALRVLRGSLLSPLRCAASVFLRVPPCPLWSFSAPSHSG